MGKYELLGYHRDVAERSPALDFVRVAMLLGSAGSFVTGEWVLGVTALFLAVLSGHGIPNEVSHFKPGAGGIRW
jgi:hypothetical protein